MRLNRSDYRTVQPLGIEFLIVSFVPVPSGQSSLPSGRTPLAARSAGGGGAERITARRPVRPNEAASTADHFSDRRNLVSDAEHVKSVCWRGSPDPLQRPRPARLLGEGLAGSFKRLRSPCGRSHRSDRRNRPQRWSSSRLCRVHPALDRVGAREGQLPLPNTPSVADDAGGLRRGCIIGVAAGVTALALACGCCV